MTINRDIRPRWSEEEKTKATELQAAGLTPQEIAIEMGKGEMAIRGFFRWQSMSEEQRRERNAKMRKRRRDAHPYLKGIGLTYTNRVEKFEPCPIALAERDRIMSLEPVSLSASLMGDPLPGRSALDRR